MSRKLYSGSNNPNWHGGDTLLSCRVCGKQFLVPPLRKFKAKYCSLACWNSIQAEFLRTHPPAPRPPSLKKPPRMVSLTCRGCKVVFQKRYTLRNSRQFCSYRCFHGNRVLIPKKKPNVCAWCGEVFYTQTKAKHCSLKCGRARRVGSLAPAWKGGVSTAHEIIRASQQYADWRSAVFMRDGYVCRKCKHPKRAINAHHIKRFADFPKLRFDLGNGIALCEICHNKSKSRELEFEEEFRSILAQPQ